MSINPFVATTTDIDSSFKLGEKPSLTSKILSTIDTDDELEIDRTIHLPDHRKTPEELVDDDFNLSRETIRELLALKMKALEEYGELVSSTDSPRAYEVYSNMVDSTVDISHKLIELHEKKNKTLEKSTGTSTTTNIQNQQINMLSPVEVIRMLREGTIDEQKR